MPVSISSYYQMSDCIPHEVLVEILTRLPPKSLLRFRCVSKSWLCLISSSTFISMHAHQTTLTKSENTHSLVRRYSETDKKELYSIHLNNETFDIDEQVKIEFPIKYSWGKYFRIVGSCNGLLCLSDDIFGYTNTIILWNPSIRRKLTLPRPYATFDKVGAFKSALGFGLDTKTNEYKVVRITYLKEGDDNTMSPMVEIYVLGTGNWRALSGALPQYYMVDRCWSQAFISGKVHWVAFYGREGCGTWVHSLIMTFDMRDEVFEGMMLPEGLACEYPFHMYANVVRESLSIFHYSRGLQCQSCSIWVMKEYGVAKSWSKQFNVDLEEGLGEALCLRNNGEILLATRGGELVSYDAVTQRSLNLGLIGTAASFYVDTYKESLALLIEGIEDSGTQASNNKSSLSDGEDESEDNGVENLNF